MNRKTVTQAPGSTNIKTACPPGWFEVWPMGSKLDLCSSEGDRPAAFCESLHAAVALGRAMWPSFYEVRPSPNNISKGVHEMLCSDFLKTRIPISLSALPQWAESLEKTGLQAVADAVKKGSEDHASIRLSDSVGRWGASSAGDYVIMVHADAGKPLFSLNTVGGTATVWRDNQPKILGVVIDPDPDVFLEKIAAMAYRHAQLEGLSQALISPRFGEQIWRDGWKELFTGPSALLRETSDDRYVLSGDAALSIGLVRPSADGSMRTVMLCEEANKERILPIYMPVESDNVPRERIVIGPQGVFYGLHPRLRIPDLLTCDTLSHKDLPEANTATTSQNMDQVDAAARALAATTSVETSRNPEVDSR